MKGKKCAALAAFDLTFSKIGSKIKQTFSQWDLCYSHKEIFVRGSEVRMLRK